MSEPLKYMYNPQFFEELCPILKEVIPHFEERKFVYRVFDTSWPDLELKQRTRQVTKALRECLPNEFPKAVKMVVDISNLLRQKNKQQRYPYIFLPDYIELCGLDHLDLSMEAFEESTQLISAEFAIRPFILRYPTETMQYMMKWSEHPQPSVRRLSSEGCRPRLPWGIGIPALKKDPSSILPILENLKEDASEDVRRSVANNLNDIAKDHPEIALKLAKKWRGKSEATDWIIKHGCRTLLKKGDQSTLRLHGFDPTSKSEIVEFTLPDKVAIGNHLDFSFAFIIHEKRATRFRLEYAIDYITRSGKKSIKVFKISENVFFPSELIRFKRKQSFKDLTTRKHFKGKHRIRLLANGKELANAEFFVI
jgi:3-methyladenine DNA glycosylase AlkC